MNIQTVDSQGDVGGYSSLALDSNGYPCISYFDDTNNDLKFARGGYSVTIEAWDVEGWLAEPITMDGSSTGFTTAHEFAGLSGNHTFTFPSVDGRGYPFVNWNTGETNNTITVDSEGVYVARYTPELTVSLSPNSADLFVGNSTVFTATASGGGEPMVSYQWYVDGEAQSGETASTFNYAADSEGSHSITVTVTDNLGVTSPHSDPATVNIALIPDFTSYLFLPFLMLATMSAIALKKRFRK